MRRAIWVLIVLSIPSGLEAQTADEILDLMADSYAARISGIDDYT